MAEQKTIFNMMDWPEFLNAYSDFGDLDQDQLKQIWDFGNESYSKGFNQGYKDPNFDREEE